MCIRDRPTTLSPDGRNRPPHLRTWRDGWRHLLFMLLFTPRWLFLIPGTLLAGGGLIGIGFWAEAICDASPAGIAAALEAAVALLGEDVVALGSDFDGAVTTTIDAAGLPAITAARVRARSRALC